LDLQKPLMDGYQCGLFTKYIKVFSKCRRNLLRHLALREIIRNERRVELALEGQRYMDIRRWKIAPQVMKTINNIKNTQAQERTWEDRFYLMPVPQKEVDLSKGVLTQNTGYN